MRTRFHKYHALGNDYLVLDPKDWGRATPPTPEEIRKICHRHYGLGSDGILYGPVPDATEAGVTPAMAADASAARNTCGAPAPLSAAPAAADTAFVLRIFNPDGSEAEKSGNGLRIFSRYLFDCGLVREGVPFEVATPGGRVECTVFDGGASVRVEMGRVSFSSGKIPVNPAAPEREVLNETLSAGGRDFFYCAATVGNPHCVIPVMKAEPELATRYGPLIETHAAFPNRTNVQFLEILSRSAIRIEIWERGAGYTYASGSSSSAAAAVARKLGLCDAEVAVHMPGGVIQIAIAPDFSITMTGPVTPVGTFEMRPDVLAQEPPGL